MTVGFGLYAIFASFYVKNEPNGKFIKRYQRQILFTLGALLILFELL